MELVKDKVPSIIIIASSPNSGKSTLVKYILCDLFAHQKLCYGLVFCSTAWNAGYDFLPSKYIYKYFDEDAFINLINIQVKQIKDNGRAKPCFLVFDDMLASVNFTSPQFTKLKAHIDITTSLLSLRHNIFINFQQSLENAQLSLFHSIKQQNEALKHCVRPS